MKIKMWLTYFAVTSLVVCCVSQCLAAFGLPNPTKPNGSGGGNIDVQALSSHNTAVIYHCKVATVYVAKSLCNIEIAVGNKTEAEKLLAAIKALDPPKKGDANKDDKDKTAATDDNSKTKTDDANQKSSNGNDTTVDPDKLKVLMTEVNTDATDIAKLNLQTKIDKEAAKKEMRESLLYLGAGIIVDTKVVSDTKTQIDQTKSAIASLSADPTKISTVGTLKALLDTLLFLLNNVPGQLNSMSAVNKGLNDYAKANAIDTPSDKDVKKQSDDMQKG